MIIVHYIITEEYLNARYTRLVNIYYDIICLICAYRSQDLKLLNSR